MTAPMVTTYRQKGQHEHLNAISWPDQHGRMWAGTINDVSGHPEGMLSPDGWRPPLARLLPDQKYIKPAGGKFAPRLVIDYDAWIADWSEANRTYANWALYVAKKQYPQGGALEALANKVPQLMAEVGAPPQHVDLVKAMRAGNRWALGLPDKFGNPAVMPEKARDLIDSWTITETWGGVDGEQAFDPTGWVDADDDAGAVAYADPLGSGDFAADGDDAMQTAMLAGAGAGRSTSRRSR